MEFISYGFHLMSRHLEGMGALSLPPIIQSLRVRCPFIYQREQPWYFLWLTGPSGLVAKRRLGCFGTQRLLLGRGRNRWLSLLGRWDRRGDHCAGRGHGRNPCRTHRRTRVDRPAQEPSNPTSHTAVPFLDRSLWSQGAPMRERPLRKSSLLGSLPFSQVPAARGLTSGRPRDSSLSGCLGCWWSNSQASEKPLKVR